MSKFLTIFKSRSFYTKIHTILTDIPLIDEEVVKAPKEVFFARKKYTNPKILGFKKVDVKELETKLKSDHLWEDNYITNTTAAVDRGIKEIMARTLAQREKSKLPKEHIELFNGMTPAEEAAKILGESSLFEMIVSKLENDSNS